MMSYVQEQNTFNKLRLWDEFLGFSTTTFDKHTGRYRAAHLVSSRTFDSGNTEITVYCLVETCFRFSSQQIKSPHLKTVSPFVSPSAWPPPSDDWTGTCWSCRAESQHLDRNTTDRDWKHCTRLWRQRLSQMFSQWRSWREATDEVCGVSPWLSCDGCVTWTPFTEHWAPPSGTRVTLPFWFSNMQCSLSRSRPCRTAGGKTTRETHGDCEQSHKTNFCTTTTIFYRSSVWDGRVKKGHKEIKTAPILGV